jgi:hypothetical protein
MSSYRHAGDKGKRRYSLYSFFTSALDDMIGQHHARAALYPRGEKRQRNGERRSERCKEIPGKRTEK